MKVLPCTTESFTKTEVFRYVQSSNLPFIKDFGSTIDSRRALMGRDCHSALFYYSAEFVYVRHSKCTRRTYNLIIQTHMCPSMAARAFALLSLLYSGGCNDPES